MILSVTVTVTADRTPQRRTRALLNITVYALIASAAGWTYAQTPSPPPAQGVTETASPTPVPWRDLEEGGPLALSPLQAIQAPRPRRYGVVPYRVAKTKGSQAAASGAGAKAITPTCQNPHLAYYNGPVVSHVNVIPVFWSSHVNSQLTANMPQFLSDLREQRRRP